MYIMFEWVVKIWSKQNSTKNYVHMVFLFIYFVF